MPDSRPILYDDDERRAWVAFAAAALTVEAGPLAAAERADQLLGELRARYRLEVQDMIREREQFHHITPN